MSNAPTQDELNSQIQYRMVEDLASSHARQRRLLENLDAAVFSWNSQGRLLYVNPAWEHLVGLTAAESVGATLIELQGKGLPADLIRSLEQGKSGASVELCVGPRVLRLRSVMELNGEWQAVLIDVTAEAIALARAERMQRLDAALVAALSRLHVADSIREEFPQAWLEIEPLLRVHSAYLGRAGGGSKLDVVHENKASNITISDIALCIHRGETAPHISVFAPTDPLDELRFAVTHEAPEIDPISAEVVQRLVEALQIGLIRERALEALKEATAHAETARRRAAENERQRGQVLATVSHELRTPLASIVGFSELLSFGGLRKEEQSEFLNILRDQSLRLSRLVDDLLEASRASRQALNLNLRPVQSLRFLQTSAEAVRPMMKAASLTFDVQVDVEQDVALTIDPERISQVCTNLLDNARKFTPVGGRVSITAKVSSDHIEIIIADTGIGMPTSELERIFQPFVSLENNTASQYGLGLGLSICREIVSLHKGELSVESKAGSGTTMTLRLPL